MNLIDSRQHLVDAMHAQMSAEAIENARAILIDRQLDGLEKLIEGGRASVKSPGSWNVCAGLIQQLRLYAPGIWNPAIVSDNSVVEGMGIPLMKRAGEKSSAELSNSHPHRVVDEHAEVGARLRSLETFVGSSSFPDLSAEEKQRLVDQHRHMGAYYKVLSERIQAFTPEPAA
jgi:hypothetical protein